jgi:hypothetical protein
MPLLPLLLVTALGAGASAATDPHPAPWYLPRSLSLGVFLNDPIVAPHVRLSWEVGLIEQPRNHLVGLLSVGSGFGVGLPAGMEAHFQHVLMGGLGYRSTRGWWHWGFSAGAGPLWYRTGFGPGSLYGFESRVVGYSEATARLGLLAASHLVIGLQGGYAAVWAPSPYFRGDVYAGGIAIALFADWR